MLKAGDRAPELDWTKVRRSPTDGVPGLTGEYTVLRFCPNVTANADAIGRWDDLIRAFEGRPVRFVWIASEPWTAVEPFLRRHPIQGWLLIDETGQMIDAYGRLRGEDAIVDPAGKILGFTFVQAEQLAAVLDGNAVAIAAIADEDEVMGLLVRGKVLLRAEPTPPFHLQNHRPDIPASYEVHITPSHTRGTGSYSGSDFWVQRGFDLNSIVSTVYSRDSARVRLPESLDGGETYDFVVVLPGAEDRAAIYQLVQRAIETRFGITPAPEQVSTDVYILTAIPGKTPRASAKRRGSGSSIGSTGQTFMLPEGTPNTPEAVELFMQELMRHPEQLGISNISAWNTTIDGLCRELEGPLQRPIVDETGLQGRYDVEVEGHAANNDEFIRMLAEQAGLVLTPATRSLEMLIFRSTR